VLKGLDAELPLNRPGRLSEVVQKSVGQQRLLFTLLGLFAALALVLAAVGVYSTVAYTVTLRTSEIGVRVALGARPYNILRLVLRQGLKPVLAGMAVGLAGCFVLGQFLQAQLYEVSATEPRMLAAACVGLLAVAAVACWLPARKAMRVDPIAALRAG
jgi:putative ABC transport system permease protein